MLWGKDKLDRKLMDFVIKHLPDKFCLEGTEIVKGDGEVQVDWSRMICYH